jgi:hypothetical protein
MSSPGEENSQELSKSEAAIKSVELEGISLSLEASLPKLQRLFQLKDDLQVFILFLNVTVKFTRVDFVKILILILKWFCKRRLYCYF